MRSSPSVLWLDLGGVLVDVDKDRILSNMAHVLGVDVPTAETTIFEPGLKERLDTGKMDVDTFLVAICRAVGIEADAITMARLVAAWCSGLSSHEEATTLLPSLNERWVLVAGSNIDPLHAAFIRDTFPWSNLLADAWLSFEAGVVKPDPSFFLGGLAGLGLAADDVIFIDDRAENIAAAQKVGLHTIHAPDTPRLVADLVSLGFLDVDPGPLHR